MFVVGSLILMTVDHRSQHLESVRAVLGTLVYPLQYAIHVPIKAGRWATERLTAHADLAAANSSLREKQLLLQSRLEKFFEIESENRRLRELLKSSVKVGERVLIAELLSVDMDPFSRRIVLNKGTRAGVSEGQSLIDAFGVMGQVVHTGPFSSTALLITDPSHALPVQINRNGMRAVAVGTGSREQLELAHVPNNADVQVGDLLITSGLGGRFPGGYPVGRIIRVERDSGRPFAKVIVQPSARLERNREVLLVWKESGANSAMMPQPEAKQ